MNKVLLASLVMMASCGKEPERGGALSKRPLKKEHQALVQRLAEAVARKDYKAAFETTAPTFRSQVGWDEFLESIQRYRESTSAVPTFTLSATEDDPKNIEQDGMVELLVPADQRKRIVEEVAIHFSVNEGKDDEGFWALVCWIVEESDGPRILNYYQDD
jgi:hypothetical protein